MIRILFVCMGNICRSPTAESVMRELAKREGLSSILEVDSAGTHTYREGELPDLRVRRTAASRGYDLSGIRARRVKDQDFTRFDCILAMDRQNLESLRRSCPSEHLSKLGLFLDYADGLALDEIPDPYYGGPEGFEKVLDLCELGAQGLLGAIAKPGFGSIADRRGRP